MAVMEREKWTDERLDDLSGRVDRGFAEVKGEVRNLRTEMNERFSAVDNRFDSMNGRFDSMNGRFDSLQRTMIIGFVTLFASIVASLIGVAFAS
jgi:hypothetical protein